MFLRYNDLYNTRSEATVLYRYRLLRSVPAPGTDLSLALGSAGAQVKSKLAQALPSCCPF